MAEYIKTKQFSFTHNGYYIYYYVDMFPSCCGMSVVHGFQPSLDFASASEKDQLELLAEFSKFLTRSRIAIEKASVDGSTPATPMALRRNKLLIADAVWGEYGMSSPSLYKMCYHSPEWEEIGTPILNNNSGNNVTLFEYNK